MLSPGLLSVTFRKLSPQEIVELARDAGLQSIEWGGDIHVPPGNLANVREIRRIMDDAGLVTAAYGSYYRLGGSDESEFSAVIEAANVLGAPGIRVWAGNRGTADSNDTYFQSVVVEALRLADLAQKANVVLSLEFHGGTLNDTYESSRRLLSACAHPAIATYWQRPLGLPEHESLDGLLSILPRVRDVHVFHWTAGSSGLIRHPLSEGSDFWNLTFNILRSSGRNHSVMLEFVCDDSPEVFREDAKTLVSLLDDSECLPA